jgi:DNA topoisomerase-1
MDLPQNELGVDIKKNFEPTYVIIKGKQKILKKIIDTAKEADEVFLAPDPDREGEAIAWHIGEEIQKKAKKKKVHRILFNEITEKAIKEAIKNPKALDKNLFEAQQARRILDRLVGYQISPILWKKVRRGLSAGRVQSVAVRIVCERETEIAAFVAKEYWSIVAHLLGSKEPPFEAKLFKFKGENVEVSNEKSARGIVKELEKLPFILEKITRAKGRETPRRRSSQASCSRRRRENWGSPQERRWPWRSSSTRASSLETLGLWDSSRT